MYESLQPGPGPESNDTSDGTSEKARAKAMIMARDANYRPLPLRWPFLAGLMTLFLAAIGLVVYAHLAMPDSDSTAHVSQHEHKVRRAVSHDDDDTDDANDADYDELVRRKLVTITSSVPYTVTPSAVSYITVESTQTTTITYTLTNYGTQYFTYTDARNGTPVVETTTIIFAEPTVITTTSEEEVYPSTIPAVSVGVPYITYGKTTLTIDDGTGPASTSAPAPAPPLVGPSETTATKVIHSVAHGSTVTRVSTPDPLTMTKSVAGGPLTSTKVLDTLSVETFVSHVGKPTDTGAGTTTTPTTPIKVTTPTTPIKHNTPATPITPTTPTTGHDVVSDRTKAVATTAAKGGPSTGDDSQPTISDTTGATVGASGTTGAATHTAKESAAPNTASGHTDRPTIASVTTGAPTHSAATYSAAPNHSTEKDSRPTASDTVAPTDILTHSAKESLAPNTSDGHKDRPSVASATTGSPTHGANLSNSHNDRLTISGTTDGTVGPLATDSSTGTIIASSGDITRPTIASATTGAPTYSAAIGSSVAVASPSSGHDDRLTVVSGTTDGTIGPSATVITGDSATVPVGTSINSETGVAHSATDSVAGTTLALSSDNVRPTDASVATGITGSATATPATLITTEVTVDGTVTTEVLTRSAADVTNVVAVVSNTADSVITGVRTRTHALTSLVVYTTRPRHTTIVSTRHATTATTTAPDSTVVSTAVSTMSVSVTGVPSNNSTGNGNGNGTSSSSSSSTGGHVKVKVLDLNPGYYFVATFLPTLVAVLLSLPLRAIDANAKMYQPLHALTRPGGARGSESLTLEFSGVVGGIRASVWAAYHQAEYVPLVTTLLVALSASLAPLATEALGLKLHGTCSLRDESGCAGAMGVSVAPAFALVGVLGAMVVLLAVLLALVGVGGKGGGGRRQRWRTGVRAAPWSLAGLASLTACADLVEGSGTGTGTGTDDDDNARRRQQQRSMATASEHSLKRALADGQFALGVYETEPGRYGYGIVPVDASSAADNSRADVNVTSNEAATTTAQSSFLRSSSSNSDDPNGQEEETKPKKEKQQPFLALTVAYRVVFIVFLAALLGVVLAYHIAAAGAGSSSSNPTTNAFGHFVATNSFGVGFVMAAVGVAISFGWAALLATVATVAPFQAMAAHPRAQPAERSVLLPSRPTNEFSSLWIAVQLLGLSVDLDRRPGRPWFLWFPRIRRARHAPPLQHALFLALVAVMTLLSEFLPVLLTNVPYRATQTRVASVVCARIVAAVLVLMLLTLVASFVAVRWPALPADPRTLAGSMYYTVDSHALPDVLRELHDRNDGKAMSLMTTAEQSRCLRQLGRRYYYGDVIGRSGRRRLAVDADAGVSSDPEVDTASSRRHRLGNGDSDERRAALIGRSTAYEDAPYYIRNHEAVYRQQAELEGLEARGS